jgi:hypothetical protein
LTPLCEFETPANLFRRLFLMGSYLEIQNSFCYWTVSQLALANDTKQIIRFQPIRRLLGRIW